MSCNTMSYILVATKSSWQKPRTIPAGLTADPDGFEQKSDLCRQKRWRLLKLNLVWRLQTVVTGKLVQTLVKFWTFSWNYPWKGQITSIDLFRGWQKFHKIIHERDKLFLCLLTYSVADKNSNWLSFTKLSMEATNWTVATSRPSNSEGKNLIGSSVTKYSRFNMFYLFKGKTES